MNNFKLVLIFQFSVLSLVAQNLVVNGGFEIYKKCPDNMGHINYATGWEDQNAGSGDYFNTCSINNKVTILQNRPLPHTGNGYAGFCSIKQQAFEFIQTKLISPLSPEKSYCLELFFNKATQRVVTYEGLTLLFSKSESKIAGYAFHSDKLIRENNLVIYPLSQNLYNEWVAIRIIYKPKAAEQFLTIGISKSNKEDNLLEVEQPYYYIDDISLTELKDGIKCNCTDSTTTDYSAAMNKPLTLKNITFQTNSAILLPVSYNELNKLAGYIKAHPRLEVELSGHTDNVGKGADNLKLSESRAKAVADYLISRGIIQNRISYKGYGSSKPVADNITEENKAKNRRVELVFR